MKKTELKEMLESLKGAEFISLLYRAKGTGELARHVISIGADKERIYREDLETLFSNRRKLAKLGTVENKALRELVSSLAESLKKGIGENSAFTRKGTFETIGKGLRLLDSGELEITGLSIGKTVIEKGTEKTVKSSEKTIAKNRIRSFLKQSKIRSFSVSIENLKAIKTRGNEMELEFSE